MGSLLFPGPIDYYKIMGYLLIIFIILLGLFLIIFLAIRWLLLWYWKINKIVKLLEEININTQVIAKSTYKEDVLEDDSSKQIMSV